MLRLKELPMRLADFLPEFEDFHFPSAVGPWITKDAHDPPFTDSQLREMSKRGVIEIEGDRYRLTLKATALRQKYEGTTK